MFSKGLVEDPDQLAQLCRTRAEHMFTIASTMSDKRVRESLKRQAREWERMADQAERRAKPTDTKEPTQ